MIARATSVVREWAAWLVTDTPQQAQRRVCAYLAKEESGLSQGERRFVAIMQRQLTEGRELHANHAKRLGELYAVAQGDATA